MSTGPCARFGPTDGLPRLGPARTTRPQNPAGRNDLAMAGYLPYGDFFITQGGPQKLALTEVASEAEITCRVLSLDEFESLS
jgi:hypothetical protein